MSENKIPYKIYLSESEIPSKWYNLRADMKNKPAPLLNPGTGKPMTAEELSVTVLLRLYAPTALKRLSALLRRFTISLRATTPAEATSSTPQSPRLITPKSRA